MVRALFDRKSSTIPDLVTLISVLFNVIIAIDLMGPAVGTDKNLLTQMVSSVQSFLGVAQLAHFGIALAGSSAALVSLVVLTLFLPSVGISLEKIPILKSVTISLISAALMLGSLFGLKSLIPSVYILVPIAVPVGIICYLAATFALGSEEAKRLIQTLAKAVRTFLE